VCLDTTKDQRKVPLRINWKEDLMFEKCQGKKGGIYWAKYNKKKRVEKKKGGKQRNLGRPPPNFLHLSKKHGVNRRGKIHRKKKSRSPAPRRKDAGGKFKKRRDWVGEKWDHPKNNQIENGWGLKGGLVERKKKSTQGYSQVTYRGT